MFSKQKKESGIIFLEILIAVALIGIAFITLLGMGANVLNLSNNIRTTIQADSLAKEEIEALRSYRDGTNWAANGLGTNNGLGTVSAGSSNPYYLTVSSGRWNLVSGAETQGIFTRKIVFDAVYRDANGNIAGSGALDSNTKKVTVTIGWPGKTYQVITYLTNWK